MPLKLYPTPGDFLRANSLFLCKYEPQSQLNLVNASAHRGEPCTPALLFGRVELAGEPVLLFGNTLPHTLCLNAAPADTRAPEAARELARYIRGNAIEIAGVSGRDELCEPFMQAYGGEFRLREALDIMVLDSLKEPTPCPGSLRWAGMEDLDMVVGWKCATIREAIHEEPKPAQVRETTRGQIERSVLLLMVDPEGQPVSMANFGRETEHGACISGVYTPPEHRGKGYCQNTVAALCRELLSSGKRYCTLFVDRKNPISNRVYRKIGFYVIGDHFEFVVV